MFEIQGSYLHRGFMMSPTFWKIQLKKFNPNIDMLLKDETRHFLDNVITNSEQLFGDEVKKDIQDGTMPEQYKTISTTFDSSRRAIHPEVSIKPLKYTFNFASLIENYYDFTQIPLSDLSYELTSTHPPVAESMNIENLRSLDPLSAQLNDVVLAYQGSQLFTAWKNGALLTNDKNVKGTSTLFCRVRGPFDTIPNNDGQSVSGRYVRVEGYRNLSFKDQRDLLIDTIGVNKYIKFKVRQTGVVYSAQPKFNKTDSQNLSYTSLFNVPSTSDVVKFLDGFDNDTNTGVKIEGLFTRYFATHPEGDLDLTVTINSQVKNYTIVNFKSDSWHAMVVSMLHI